MRSEGGEMDVSNGDVRSIQQKLDHALQLLEEMGKLIKGELINGKIEGGFVVRVDRLERQMAVMQRIAVALGTGFFALLLDWIKDILK